ncbi:MAG: hypothetical protein ACI4I3_00895 [Acutalibacteraceae bacterium]
MKKALAIVLALVMAFSMSAIAFAEDTSSTTAAATTAATTKAADKPAYGYNTCTKCGAKFENESEFNKHVAECTVGDAAPEKDYVDLTIKEILNMIIDLAKNGMAQWDAIESVVIRLVDFLENIGSAAIPQADVEGAVADLEGALAGLKSADKDNLLDALKAKIKALYAGEKATTEAETTAEAPADTGSASVGIAVFAAVSVAAAAAYVCTKKKA